MVKTLRMPDFGLCIVKDFVSARSFGWGSSPLHPSPFTLHGATAILIAVALSGCGSIAKRESAPVARAPDAATAPSRPATPRRGGYYLNDGPGDNPPPNIDEIPDAVPTREPLHRGTMRPYNVMGKNYTPMTQLAPYKARGTATWYGRRYHGQKTASGEIYDMYRMTAAHTILPIPSFARVTNLATDKSVVVRINDRGPFHSDRLIDLSYTAAYKLGLLGGGSALVEVETIMPDAGTPITPTVAASPAPAAAPLASKPVASAPASPVPPSDGAPASSEQGPAARGAGTRLRDATAKPAVSASVIPAPCASPGSDPKGSPLPPCDAPRLRDANVRESGAAPSSAGVASVSGVTSPKGAPVPPSDGAPRPAAPLTPAATQEPVAATPVVAVSAARKGVFLQFGAFGSQDNANNYLARLRTQVGGLAPALHVYLMNGLFRVHAGPYANQTEARAAADRISQALGIKTIVLVR